MFKVFLFFIIVDWSYLNDQKVGAETIEELCFRTSGPCTQRLSPHYSPTVIIIIIGYCGVYIQIPILLVRCKLSLLTAWAQPSTCASGSCTIAHINFHITTVRNDNHCTECKCAMSEIHLRAVSGAACIIYISWLP